MSTCADKVFDMPLLIGNGKSVLEKTCGPTIDKFKTVARFNNFRLRGYEEYVGKRLTHFVLRGCDDVNLYSLGERQKAIVFCTYCRYTRSMERVARQIQGHYGSKCKTISPAICKKTGDKLHLDQPHREWCSVGVLAIDYFLCSHPQIILHGFDGLRGDTLEKYFSKPKDGHFHNFAKEQKYIRGLQDSGKILLLRDIAR